MRRFQPEPGVGLEVISLWQPWASALFTRVPPTHFVAGDAPYLKTGETRHWQLPGRLVGKWILIHAAKRNDSEVRHYVEQFTRSRYFHANFDFPRGCILGAVKVLGCVPTETAKPNSRREIEFGNFERGRFWWAFGERHPIANPAALPVRGYQAFFKLPRQEHEWVKERLPEEVYQDLAAKPLFSGDAASAL